MTSDVFVGLWQRKRRMRRVARVMLALILLAPVVLLVDAIYGWSDWWTVALVVGDIAVFGLGTWAAVQHDKIQIAINDAVLADLRSTTWSIRDEGDGMAERDDETTQDGVDREYEPDELNSVANAEIATILRLQRERPTWDERTFVVPDMRLAALLNGSKWRE